MALPISEDRSSGAARVRGHCPMGCGETLVLSDERFYQPVAPAGTICCTAPNCPEPFAVDEILRDQEVDHLVTLDEVGWNARHPLRERLRGQLLTCGIGQAVAEYLEVALLQEPEPGVFRFKRLDDDSWAVERLSTP